VRVLRAGSLSAGDIATWRQLAAEAAEPNPFFEPEFVLPAVRHLGSGRERLVVVQHGERWTACLPVSSEKRPVPHLEALTHAHAFCSTPLVADGHVEGATDALVEFLTRPRKVAWTSFRELHADGPIGRAMADALARRGIDVVLAQFSERAALLPRSAIGDGYLLRPKRRREVDRKRRALSQALGVEVTAVDRAGDERAVDQLLDLENAAWKGDTGASLRARRGGAEFLHEVFRNFHAAGRLTLLALMADDRPVAFTSALHAKNGAFGFLVGHDPELARQSPGIQVQVALGRRLLASGTSAWLDSCADPANETQNRLWPDRRRLARLVLPTRSPLTPMARLAVAVRERTAH
jgi:CelD/BcsL family acetyltransferase involved in cellulose biosynthesis